ARPRGDRAGRGEAGRVVAQAAVGREAGEEGPRRSRGRGVPGRARRVQRKGRPPVLRRQGEDLALERVPRRLPEGRRRRRGVRHRPGGTRWAARSTRTTTCWSSSTST